MNYEIDMFCDEVESYVANISRSTPGVKFYQLSDRFMEKEVIKSSTALVPLIGLLLFFMFTFSILSNSSRKPLKNKPLEGAAACLSSTMAILSSIGLLLHCNVTFNGTVYAVPFITMAIGICDSFLTIQAWKLTDPWLPAKTRLSKALSESGTAITVTSLTDIALFAIGLLSETPAIKVFSIFATVAMTFDYLYQITFFVAVIFINGKRETEKRPCLQPTKATFAISDFLRDVYAPFLCRRSTKIVGMLVYVIYLFASFWFTSRIKVHFTPTKLVSEDSPLVSYAKMFDHYQVYSRELQIFVLSPPDFHFVRALETTKYSGGEKTTNLWLRNYMDFMQLYGWQSDEFYEHVTEFLDVLQSKHYTVQLRLTDDDEKRVEKFYFTTNFHTSVGIEEWSDILKLCRKICNQYAELDAVVDIGYQAMVTDQLASIVPNTLQTVSTAFICLMVMSACVIPRPSSIFLVGLMLFSMDLGVIGFLCLWNVDLDPVSIINIVISLDFAVEYAVHICHFYYKSPSTDPREKLRHSLGTVGWPVMQGGLTTILGVLPFSFTKLYVSQAFMKTCLLVVCTGSFHAFLVVPILLLINSGRSPLNLRSLKNISTSE
ncbi:unnamed protein product [Soboliphyme baturini]|uniref:SSD domain-containing protein n=1 Tax=Soboliphyme baturini TaxID=241478 RepID=A0A183J4P7_9BILA|nr:unnamed protein product [Soboliphyme baturini]